MKPISLCCNLRGALPTMGPLSCLGLLTLAGCCGVTGGRSAAGPEPRSRIRIVKTLHHPNAQVVSLAYTSAQRPVLTEELALMGADKGKVIGRVSTDNGRTWKAVPLAPREERRGDRIVHRGTATYHLHAKAKVLVQFYSEFETQAGEEMSFGPEAAAQDLPELRTGRIFTRLSRDEGETWGPAQQIVQKGDGYDPVHWAPGLWYGKNSASLTELTRPLELRDGALLVPLYFGQLDEQGRLIKWPDRFGDTVWPVTAAACLRGEWRPDLGDFEWTMSTPVTTPEYMSRGLDESEVAEVDDGKLLMVVRGDASARQAFPAVKFLATSRDGGLTWGPAVPLTYPDGSFVHSPASLPNLFRSAKNGRLYLIANILQQPTRMGDPRYPLAIAEVDPKYFWVLPETVTVITDRAPGQSPWLRFSNWQRIEDRETGNPVIYLTEGLADAILPGSGGEVSRDSYRYEIVLPDGT